MIPYDSYGDIWGESTAPLPTPEIKRQKSNDLLPVRPTRRVTGGSTGSIGMFSGRTQRESIEYAELSKRGIAINMQKHQATGELSDETERSMAAMSSPGVPATKPWNPLDED
jgi:hypothetical protein